MVGTIYVESFRDDLSNTVIRFDRFSFRPLRKWWAQYMESIGEMETALQFYESAQDNLSLVRVNCYCGNVSKVAMLSSLVAKFLSCVFYIYPNCLMKTSLLNYCPWMKLPFSERIFE